MCARRFLLILFVLILLVVAGAFAIFQWGGEVLMRQATPRGHFQQPPPASGPDYAEAVNWVARPDLPSNPSFWGPEGASEPLTGFPVGQAAVFYIHPTTYLERDRWNAPIKGHNGDFRTDLFVQSQASVFNRVGDIWAPRYRQAAYGAFLLKSEDAQKALDLAYRDVAAAFDHFLEKVPRDRPMILAGHSQGALHLSRLLTDRGPRLRQRLIAAYVVGWPLSTTADLPPMGLPPCTAPEQKGCILSWQSFAEPANPDLVLGAWVGTKGPTGVERRRQDMLCGNPLTGTAGGSAPAQANPGTLVPTASLTSAQLVPARVGARCENGFLLLSGKIPTLGPFVLPGNNYHVYDYALFWSAIRRDADRRVTGRADL